MGTSIADTTSTTTAISPNRTRSMVTPFIDVILVL